MGSSHSTLFFFVPFSIRFGIHIASNEVPQKTRWKRTKNDAKHTTRDKTNDDRQLQQYSRALRCLLYVFKGERKRKRHSHNTTHTHLIQITFMCIDSDHLVHIQYTRTYHIYATRRIQV